MKYISFDTNYSVVGRATLDTFLLTARSQNGWLDRAVARRIDIFRTSSIGETR